MTRPPAPLLLVLALLASPIEGTAQPTPRRSVPIGLRPPGRDAGIIPGGGTPPGDHWFGADKARHAGASAAIQIMGFGVLRSARVGQRRSLLAAGLVSLAAGVGKELRDRRGGGDPSVRDLAWDAVGIALGSGLALAADVR